MAHSVVAAIELTPRHAYSRLRPKAGSDRCRVVSAALQGALLPHHGPGLTDVLTGEKAKKRKLEPHPTEPLPEHNELVIPTTLSIREITLAFFTYIHDRKLMDEHDKSVIHADELLQELLGVEQFPFHQLQQLLIQRSLVQPVTSQNSDPIYCTYIMKKDTASKLGRSANNTVVAAEGAPEPHLLQIDVDCAVPSLFPNRVRELLRRIKRRELEYTSSRTRARYMLSTSSQRRSATEQDERVRRAIDQVVHGRDVDEQWIPVYAALAKAAPPNTEARMAAHYDARMAYLLARLKERHQSALNAWEVVQACAPLPTSEEKKTEEEAIAMDKVE
jgi:hypothetical protein